MNINKKQAQRIARVVSNQDLLVMLNRAQADITDCIDWQQPSIVNKGCTKGAAWNILAADFHVDKDYHVLAKTNMLREFGFWLPNKCSYDMSIKTKPKKGLIHQEPKLRYFLAHARDVANKSE